MPTTDDYDKYDEQHQSDGNTHQRSFNPVSFILGLIVITACIVLIIPLATHPEMFVG